MQDAITREAFEIGVNRLTSRMRCLLWSAFTVQPRHHLVVLQVAKPARSRASAGPHYARRRSPETKQRVVFHWLGQRDGEAPRSRAALRRKIDPAMLAGLQLGYLLADRSWGTPAAATSSAPQPSVDKLRFAMAFARIVSLLMRSQDHRHYALGDLEWPVVQPMLAGQSAVMKATVVSSPTWAP